jgi:hypothetical protein
MYQVNRPIRLDTPEKEEQPSAAKGETSISINNQTFVDDSISADIICHVRDDQVRVIDVRLSGSYKNFYINLLHFNMFYKRLSLNFEQETFRFLGVESII